MDAVLVMVAILLGGGGVAQSAATPAGQKTAATEPASSAPRLFPFREDGKDGLWGYIDAKGNVVIKPKYTRAEPFREGLAAIGTTPRGYGLHYIDEKDRLVFELPKGTSPFPGQFSDGMVYFQDYDQRFKFGFYDRNGKFVVPPKYDRVRSFSEGMAAVSVEVKTASLVPTEYQDVGGFSEGLTAVNVGEEAALLLVRRKFVGKWGYIDKTGREVIPLQFDEARDFSEGLALVKTAEGHAYIDTRGKIVLTLHRVTIGGEGREVFLASGFSEGLACVRTTGVGEPYFRTAFLDKTGKPAFPRWFPHAGSFSEGLAAVSDGKKWGYMDKTGRIVIAHRFDKAGEVHEGLAHVQIRDGRAYGEAWGYINREGAFVVDAERHEGLPGPINYAGSFSGGLAEVHIGGTRVKVYDAPGYWKGSAWYYINRQGQLVRREYNDDDMIAEGKLRMVP